MYNYWKYLDMETRVLLDLQEVGKIVNCLEHKPVLTYCFLVLETQVRACSGSLEIHLDISSW